jgi:DNA-binding transcriptional ArsR family regulator
MARKNIDKNIITEEDLYDLADLFKAFSDTTRIKLLYALMEGELCVAELVEKTGATQSAVSHQLRGLKQMDLIRCRKEGKQVIYFLADDHVHTILQMGMDHVKE